MGRVICRRRHARGLTQEQLAERAGCHRNHVGFIERGEHNVSLELLTNIAKALGTTAESLCRSAKL